MREIKFRGKRIDDGEWVYGYAWKEFDEKRFIGADIGAEWDCVKYRSLVEVYPETIGQYTGLKDGNSKEIFEGDKVGHAELNDGVYYPVGIIKFGECKGPSDIQHQGFYIEWQSSNGNQWGNWFRSDLNFWIERIEIIGNIHDNPELMKGEKYEH